MSLTSEYRNHGICFHYPRSWQQTEESSDDAITVTVADAGTFWSITILHRRPPAMQVMSEALAAFQDEYEDIDEYEAQAVLNGEDALARNLEFVAMELINCVFLRVIEVGAQTLFVMAQVTDHERKDYEPQFEAITASIRVDEDGSR